MQAVEAQHDLESRIRQYLTAFEARDLDRCLDLYTEDATVHFQLSRYEGKDAIARWHRERFDADLRVIRIDDLVAGHETVVVDAAVASERLRTWKFDSLSVTLAFEFRAGRIYDLKCDLKAVPW